MNWETCKNAILPVSKEKVEAIQGKLNNLTKPIGSLGKLEDLAKRYCMIKDTLEPQMKNKVVFTLAGDHGVVEEGVSAFPQEVTQQMVLNFLNNGAGINVLARHSGARVVVADLGVKGNIQGEGLKIKKVAQGTQNMVKGPAMTKEQAEQSLNNGIELLEEELSKGVDIVCIGEMGIGNTTPASAITSVITGMSVEDVTGRGTGIDDDGLNKKVEVIKKAIITNQVDKTNGVDILSKVGGFEIGGMAGIILAAAFHKIPVVIDGFISSSAALIAHTINPDVGHYIFASHSSVEQGHRKILDYLTLEPLFDFNLRLGEGTGAALALHIIEAGIKIMNEMATFDSAGVSNKEE